LAIGVEREVLFCAFGMMRSGPSTTVERQCSAGVCLTTRLCTATANQSIRNF